MPTAVTYRRPALYPKQAEFVNSQARYVIVLASTKSGKTVAMLTWLLEQALTTGQPGRAYWWTSPVYSQARIAFRRLKRWLQTANQSLSTANESELTLTLLNGAVIFFKSAENPDNLYGEDVYACVLDEATRMRETAWHAIRSTLTATRGPVRIIGNQRGRRNWVYKLGQQAQDGNEANMAFFRLTAPDAVAAGVLDGAEVEDARRRLPDSVFRELYLAEPSDDEGNPFGIEAIHLCVAPMSPDKPFAWGWDLGKSVDWTVGVGIDVDGMVCALERFQAPWETTIPRIVARTGHTPALVDSTGVGDSIVERLQHECSAVEGFHFSSQSKQALMEGLAVAIQRREITYPPGVVVNELESFEYTYTRTGVRYEAMTGLHDDAVCALALAVQKWGSALREGRPRIRHIDTR